MKVMTIVGTRPEIIRLSRVVPCLDALTYAGSPNNVKEVGGDPRYTFVQDDVAESHVDRSIWNERGMSLLKERQL